jgi:glycosyltransferase involved in cell wall biosynthesis
MERTRKLAIITTHPIQYNAPLFKLLAQREKILIKVFYTWGESVLEAKYDPGFKREIQWDIPLLEGYEYEFIGNKAPDKGSHHFKGIDNPGLIPAIRSYAPDAILVYGWSYKSHLALLRHFHKKIPILFRGDSTLLDDVSAGYKKILRKFFLRWVYRYVDYALYVGKNNYAYFKQAGLKEKQLIYAPHAIDNSRFVRTDETVSQAVLFRQQLGINNNELVYLFAGKLESKKDPALLLQAFVESELNKKAHLVFVGNGDLEQELKEKAKGISVVHFMDFQNQSKMPAVYYLADVLVLSSKGPGETWGLALNEAMAAGKAIIASDRCGASVDVIKNNTNGYIFKASDIEDLKIGMLKIANKQIADNMGAASLEIIKEFSITRVAEAIEQVVNTSLYPRK